MKITALVIFLVLLLTMSAGSQSMDENEAYQQMLELNRLSEEAYEAGDYEEAKRLANESIRLEELSDQWIEDEALAYQASQEATGPALEVPPVNESVSNTTDLPANYVVRLLPGNTDCLWNIAGYEFIYDDPWEWRTIYNANKDMMPERENPDLILPGMVLFIPSIDGEERSGTWVDKEFE